MADQPEQMPSEETRGLARALRLEERRHAESVWAIVDELALQFAGADDAPEDAGQRAAVLQEALGALRALERRLLQLQRLADGVTRHLSAETTEAQASARTELLAVFEELDRDLEPRADASAERPAS